ncbi:uncharacterized protein L3040_008322 [Drepanopeziza brunnea f. sp. 'multigermtubi']|uniref:uncharacterized protein n=1 Tax=Drepanopeziza brunnea f. sp. 'multigermtubi' TaxID=698441 RepID=UPI00238DDC5F|nr:hypothetical protein L3040_008322 [Drepanopeziza brunnea f. sp. 'multigermtubi']
MRFTKGSSVVPALLVAGAAAAAAANVAAAQGGRNAIVEDSLDGKRGLGKRSIGEEGNYNISFYHINDVHARLDEFRASGTDCTNKTLGCFGGYARIKTVVEEARLGYKDSLFLNAGDEFQGTLFYSYYGGEKIAETLNQLGFDGMTLGNHEFDGGDDALGEFLANLTFPIISANIQSNHSVLNATIKPFHIYPEYELAVIGVTTETTPDIANSGPGTTFTDVTEAVQSTIDFIRSTTNITRIAALTHIGFEEDLRLAEATTGLYLIMGGHSHTPLGNFTGAVGEYPTIRLNQDGEEVFVVTAYRWGEYLGYIDVTYDASGKIVSYRGAPIHITNTTEQDPDLQAQINEWRVPFEAFAGSEIGITNVELDSNCRNQECLLGQFMSDAMLQYRLNQSNTADFAVINSGGIRASIDVGTITRGEVLISFPFGNSVVELEMTGDELWTTLEGVFTGVNQYTQKPVTSFIQVSDGIEILYNSQAPNGSRLVSVRIGDADLVRTDAYNVVTIDFLAGGGDNIFQTQSDITVLDTQDEVLDNYIEAQSPISITLTPRIVDTKNSTNSTGT